MKRGCPLARHRKEGKLEESLGSKRLRNSDVDHGLSPKDPTIICGQASTESKNVEPRKTTSQ